MKDLCDIIKILGVYFGGDAKKKRRTELLIGRLWNQLRKRLTCGNGEAYLL